MSDAPSDLPTPDPELLGRWIAIAALLASAQDLQTRGGGAWPALALVVADTANEAILGTIATSGDDPPGRDARFERIYELALATLVARGHAMPESLKRRLIELHRTRNAALHLGTDPTPRAVDAALNTAVELRSLAVDALPLLEAFRDAGPVRAVAELVKIEPLSSSLIAAERLLGEDKLREAADQCAIALDAALSRVKPELGSILHVPRFERTERNLGLAVQRINQRMSRIEAWILALGLGLRPAELARLQRVVGEPIYTLAGPQPSGMYRDEEVALTRPLVEWAVRLTTDVVFRLWQSEGMRQGDRWDEG